MFIPPANIRVYLALGHTDMRKTINGLSVLVEGSQLDPDDVAKLQEIIHFQAAAQA